MNVTVYTRHFPECEKKNDRSWRRCQCPKWLYSASWNPDRRSAKTRSWSKAEAIAKRLEFGEAEDRGVTVEHAVTDFLRDKREQNAGDEWQKKLTRLLEKNMLPWAEKERIRYLRDLDLEQLKKFRSTLVGSPITRQKKQEMLRTFFLYSQKQGWVTVNPAKLLSQIRADDKPTEYFKPDEYARILFSVGKYNPISSKVHEKRHRVGAMVQLLRWTGLRLGDAATLERSRLSGDKIFLYTRKSGTAVYIPLPPHVAECLRTVPNENPKYFFWSGNSLYKTTVGDWWRTLKIVFKHAGVGGAHPHQMRHTFAVELLLAGVPMEEVSILLGHQSIKVTERHYAFYCKRRQDQLEAAVMKTWA